ncbi:NYN domain-containing protein [Phormidesmis sp. 146-12]
MKGERLYPSSKLAVLIDAENTSASLIELLLTEIAKYGTAHVKRIYGDWTNTLLSSWKPKLHKLAIQPIQQFRYTTGKNATDSALIIDAMDLLYAQNFDGFCIVSSDSDFTRLASRIREAGLIVYGLGGEKTPEAFVGACDKFIYTELLQQTEAISSSYSQGVTPTESPEASAKLVEAQKADPKVKIDKKLLKLLRDAYEAIAEEDGWANLGPFGAQLNKLSPSFDARTYGHKKLSDLIRAISLFEVKKIPHAKSQTATQLSIKLKS